MDEKKIKECCETIIEICKDHDYEDCWDDIEYFANEILKEMRYRR